jgi:hypothetical protein
VKTKLLLFVKTKLLFVVGILLLGWLVTGGIVVYSMSSMFAQSDGKDTAPEIWLELRGTDHSDKVRFLSHI